MNILSSEDMLEVQTSLLNLSLQAGFELILPNERQRQNMNHFSGSMFLEVSKTTQAAVRKMMTLTDNLKGLTISDSNSVLQMFTFSIMNILYQGHYRPGSSHETENSNFLIETLKCSLFSPKLDLSTIKNSNFPINTLQMKALVSHFFHFMDEKSLRLTVDRLKCAEWILQKNHILLQTFVLFFRFILFRLEIQGANNYSSYLNMEQALVNLIEYLDLSYRSFGQLILFYEEGLFLAVVQREVVIGHYFENEIEKTSERQQNEIKSSVKLNMIESVLMNVDEKSSLIAPKAKGIVSSDLKLMNIMLDNSLEQSLEDSFLEEEPFSKEKESTSLETPTFANQPEQFHFGKRKSNRIHDDIKNEFAKLILDKSDYSEEPEFEHSEEMSTPFLGQRDDYSLSNRFIPEPQTAVDSPIDELNQVQNINIEPFSEKITTQTPKTPGGTLLGFSLGANEENFLFPMTNKEDDLNTIRNCSCRPLRINRNAIDSSVVTVGYIPEPKRKPGYPTYIPKCNYKRGQEPLKQARNHKPAFLKTLKKHNDSKESINFTKSTVTQNLKRKGSQNQMHTCQEQSFKKTSAILPQQQHQQYNTKDFDVKSSKSLNILPKNPYLDRFQGRIKNQNLAHSPSNPDHPRPERSTGQQLPNNFSHSHKGNPYKFYAPVQIIAPTVYYDSHSHHNSNMVFRVNQYSHYCQSNNPERGPYQKVESRPEGPPQSQYFSLRNPKPRQRYC